MGELDSSLKYKLNYVLNVSTIFKLDQVDQTYKKLLSESDDFTKSDECIVCHESIPKLLGMIQLGLIDYHFENVVIDSNPVFSWSGLAEKHLGQDFLKSTIKKPLMQEKSSTSCLYLGKRAPKQDRDDPANSNPTITSHKQTLESYLRARFFSTRLEHVSGLVHPHSVHTMDCSKISNFLFFACTFGLYVHGNIESLYKLYCSKFPDDTANNAAEFSSFKAFVEEFVHMLCYKETKPFKYSVLLCGLDQTQIIPRVLGLTATSQLVHKYQTFPETFLAEEHPARFSLELIQKITSQGSNHAVYEYRQSAWNNYDMFCVLLGVCRHGLEGWLHILHDKSLWNKHLELPKEQKGKQDTNSHSDEEDEEPVPSSKKPTKKSGTHSKSAAGGNAVTGDQANLSGETATGDGGDLTKTHSDPGDDEVLANLLLNKFNVTVNPSRTSPSDHVTIRESKR